MKETKPKNVKITWKISGINRLSQHRRTLRALGLRKLHQSVVKEATPQILGMIHQVSYMVVVEDAK